MKRVLPALGLALAALGAISCCTAGSHEVAIHGAVSDVAEFDRFVASQPTPDAFRGHYPDVTLVLPGEMASKELRRNRSRYFAELDAGGRITGGSFK
jgi:hypothetical protein